ncbi:MAG: alpha/beta fold hydrolase [Armatimonadetes bacterium]|nr:alpha/beta fold hydrolase [Armatimonadota bacterium]
MSTTEPTWTAATAKGDVPVFADSETKPTVVVLAPGAGSHANHPTLLWLSSQIREATGASVVRFDFLYRVQGKGMPDRMPTLVDTYRSVVASVRERLKPQRLVIGGHSMGGRVASMVESEGQTADGLVLFGYPLHPPGQPEKLRDAHLPQITTPTLQINGTNDDFCTPALMQEVLTRLDPGVWRMVWIEGADHSYHVKRASGRTKKDVEADIAAALHAFLGQVG